MAAAKDRKQYGNNYFFLIPTFLIFVSLQSEFVFATLVIYNSVCYQQFANFPNVTCDNLEDFPEIEDAVQTQSTFWSVVYQLSPAIPAIITSIILRKESSINYVTQFEDTWGDRVGRKVNILIGSSGMILRLLSFSAFAMFPEISLWNMSILTALAGLTGGSDAMFESSMCAYISDTTPDSNIRTVKMTSVCICVSFAGIVAGLQASILAPLLDLHWLCFMAGMYAVLGFITVVYLIETVVPVPQQNTQPEYTGVLEKTLALFSEAFKCLTKKRAGYNRFLLFANILTYLIVHFSNESVFTLVNLFTYRRPFQWREKMSSYYKTARSLSTTTAVAISALIFTKILNFHDATLTLICLTSVIGFMLVVSFSTTSLMMFMSAVAGSFMLIGFASTQSFVSKLVPTDEVGKIFAFMCFSEQLNRILAAAFAGNLYAITADTWPGLTFLIIAVLTSVFWFLTVIVIIVDKKYGDYAHNENNQ